MASVSRKAQIAYTVLAPHGGHVASGEGDGSEIARRARALWYVVLGYRLVCSHRQPTVPGWDVLSQLCWVYMSAPHTCHITRHVTSRLRMGRTLDLVACARESTRRSPVRSAAVARASCTAERRLSCRVRNNSREPSCRVPLSAVSLSVTCPVSCTQYSMSDFGRLRSGQVASCAPGCCEQYCIYTLRLRKPIAYSVQLYICY